MSDLSPLCAEQRTLPLPCALVLYISLNDGPETLTCAKARCAIVVRFGHAVVRVMQQRAGEVRIGATMDGSTGGDSGAEQVRADGDASGGAGGFGEHALDPSVAHGSAVVGREPQGRGRLIYSGQKWPILFEIAIQRRM
jgi:hypothetical protein